MPVRTIDTIRNIRTSICTSIRTAICVVLVVTERDHVVRPKWRQVQRVARAQSHGCREPQGVGCVRIGLLYLRTELPGAWVDHYLVARQPQLRGAVPATHQQGWRGEWVR